jgi:hypothetical protein
VTTAGFLGTSSENSEEVAHQLDDFRNWLGLGLQARERE